MTEEDLPPESDSEDAADADVRDWLKGALHREVEPLPVDVLAGVQKKLRERSGGKFYADAWSTAKESPTLTFLVTSALMLVVVALTYAVLSPLRGAAESVPSEPAPVDVIAPVK